MPSRAATLSRATPFTLVNSPPAKIWLPPGDVDTAWTVAAARASKAVSTAPEAESMAARKRRPAPPMVENAPPA